MINLKTSSRIIWPLLFCVTSCVSSTEIARNSMPKGWSVIVPDEAGRCVSINGDYQTLGLGKLSEGASLVNTRLDVALGHTFPTNVTPSRASIAIDRRTNTLSFQFGDPVNLGYSESVTCSDGWYVFEQTQTDQYVGDGAKLDYLLRKIRLGKGSDGSLVVHLILDGQFSSLSVLKSKEAAETWSRYKVAK